MQEPFRKSLALFAPINVTKHKMQGIEEQIARYNSYVQECVNKLYDEKILTLGYQHHRNFFPAPKELPLSFLSGAWRDACNIIRLWNSTVYHTKIIDLLVFKKLNGKLTELEFIKLCTIGKYGKAFPYKDITKQDIDSYWEILVSLAEKPSLKLTRTINLFHNSSSIRVAKKSKHNEFKYWLAIPSQIKTKPFKIPLKGNPKIDKLPESFSLCINKYGRIEVRVLDQEEYNLPVTTPSSPKIGVDVGLNSLAATSARDILDNEFIKRFTKVFNRIKEIRKIQQKQKTGGDSKKLRKLEAQLSGMIKTATGTVANRLIKMYPDHIFVIEDLNLSGAKGQKRFAYKAVINNLKRKAVTEEVNPAYTSQTCPSCGYFHENNRSGIKFTCHNCGRKDHADIVGAINILSRAGIKNIDSKTSKLDVRKILKKLSGISDIGWERIENRFSSPKKESMCLSKFKERNGYHLLAKNLEDACGPMVQNSTLS